MPDINDAFPSRFVRATDLKGHRVVVILDRVEYEVLDRQKKAILYFRGKEKGLVLNKTNANRLIQLLGTAITEQWSGQRVTLYAEPVPFQGGMVPGVRIAPVAIPEQPYATPHQWQQPAPGTFQPRQPQAQPEPESFGAPLPRQTAPPPQPPPQTQDEWQPDPQQVSAPVYDDEVPF